MSAEVAVRGAIVAALRGDGALGALVNGVHDGEPGRAGAPYAFVGECLGADWGGKDVDGRELRLTIGLVVADAAPARLAAMMARVGPALDAAEAADGWRIVSARLARSRVAPAARGSGEGAGWRATIDWRVRAVREG
jgi:hypothetical protein